MFEEYIYCGTKKLRCGYTTGSCAAAAVKASAQMLLTGMTIDKVSLMTPKGILLELNIKNSEIETDYAECAINKDSGDDPDVTNGILVYARVEKIPSGIIIDGGKGVGRITKSGLDRKIGEAAINTVPRRMIENAVIEIAEKYGIPHISTGDIFRANIKNGTELGKKAKTYMDQGLLVPDELTCDLVVDRIQQDDAKNGYVLDGFPRTIPQAECLTAALEKLGSKIDYAIDVDVPDDNIVNRMSGRRACLKCGATYHIVYAAPKVENVCDTCGENLVLRDDDKPETVSKRLKVYHEQTQPLIDYYTKQGVLKTVDGTAALDKVFQAIVEILGE